MLSEHNRKPIYHGSLIFIDVLLWAFVATAILATSALAQEIPEPPQFETPVIFQDNFEENVDVQPPAPRIEFVTDTILFFESPGETLPLAVRVYDENGDLDATPNLTWSSADQLLTGLTVNGPFTAEATAQQIWPGIVELVVEDNETGARASASAYFVERADSVRRQFESEASSGRGSAIPTVAHPDAISISSEDVIGWSGRDRLQEHTLHLRRNAKTEAISVGNFLYSGDQAGILVEVFQVEILAEEVRLLAEPAALNAVFKSAVFEDSVSTFGATGAAASTATVDHHGLKNSAAPANTRVALNARLGGSLECEGEGSSNVDLIDAGFEPSLVFRSKINIQDWNLDLVEFRIEASLGATLDVRLMIENTLGAECSIELVQIGFPRLRFGPAISIKPELAPKIVLSGETSLQVQGPSEWTLNNLAPTWSFNGGLRNQGSGWNVFRNDDLPSATPQPESLIMSGAGKVGLDGTFELPLKTEFCLGWCSIFSKLGGLNLFKVGIGADYAVQFASPVDKRLPGYSGPQIDSGIDGLAALDIRLEEEGWVKYLPVSKGFGFSEELFGTRWHLLQTPTLMQELGCGSDCQFEQGEQAAVQLILNAGANGPGVTEFWAHRDGEEEMLLLADSIPFSGSNGTAETTIDISGLEAGVYKVYPRLSLDDSTYWFWTENFPLGIVTENYQAPQFVVRGEGCPSLGESALNDTGIDWCAGADTNDLDCPVSNFPAQDGDCGRDALARAGQLNKVGSGAAGFDFTSLGSCVRDNHTGLVWEVKTLTNPNEAPPTVSSDLRDKMWKYTWYNPDASTNGGDPGVQDGGFCCIPEAEDQDPEKSCENLTCDTRGYVQYVNSQNLCGFSDWRLPSINELYSIVHHGRYLPSVDMGFFPNNRTSSSYWSASPAWLADSALLVNFKSGNGHSNRKRSPASIRLVRGGQ